MGEGPWQDIDIDIWIMYFSCLASLAQSCEISILLHEAKPSNQFLLKEKHVNHNLVLKFNKNKKRLLLLRTGVDNSNDTSLYSDILQKSNPKIFSKKASFCKITLLPKLLQSLNIKKNSL